MDSVLGAHLARARSGVSGELAGRLEIRSFETKTGLLVPIYLHAEDSSAYGLGELLVDVDREFRRAEAVIRESTASPRRTRSNLQVVAAQQSASIDVALTAYHLLSHLILSDPLQLAMSVEWLWERRPPRWGVRRSPSQRTFEEISTSVTRNAEAAIQSGQTVAYSLQHDADGSMRIDFVAAPELLPPSGPIKPIRSRDGSA